jgi:hypothetical protein
VIAKTDLVLTKDRERVVAAGDPDGNPLAPIAQKGEEIPEYVVKQYGIEGDLGTKKHNPAPNKEAEKPADKKIKSAENKEQSNG